MLAFVWSWGGGGLGGGVDDDTLLLLFVWLLESEMNLKLLYEKWSFCENEKSVCVCSVSEAAFGWIFQWYKMKQINLELLKIKSANIWL